MRHTICLNRQNGTCQYTADECNRAHRAQYLSPDLITRASPKELMEWENQLTTKRVSDLSLLKSFASCIPVLDGIINEDRLVDLGRRFNPIEYWSGVLVECEPFTGMVHRWAEGNRMKYAVWFAEPPKMTAMWRKNCVTYMKGRMEAICIGTARSQQDFGRFDQCVSYVEPRLGIIISPSELEWQSKPEKYAYTWTDAANWGRIDRKRMGRVLGVNDTNSADGRKNLEVYA